MLESTTESISIPEFVKKLFGMLEENMYPAIFSWGAKGDTFVVKDTNEFARYILPKYFKHSNFASFVRQLNKYDFHKVKIPEAGQRLYGDQAWEFKHPSFKYNKRELLEDIKRKPTGKSTSTPSSDDNLKKGFMKIEKEVENLKEIQASMLNKMEDFNQKYMHILNNLDLFKKNMTNQDNLIKEMLQIVSNDDNNHPQLKQIIHSYQNIASLNQLQLNQITNTITNQIEPVEPINVLPTATDINSSLIPMNSQNSKKRKRIQLGWTVPPKVLLVDDDSMFRRLSMRLLQLAGCTIDIAVDGVEAVKKLGTGKYDLVLMDIMMPKLDGMSATRNIRQYDTWTPIISMTSNITETDIQQYFMSGMTDVLAKPFNQGTLGSLLERYCAHLVIRKQHQQQLQLLQQNLNLSQQLRLVEEEEEENKRQKLEYNSMMIPFQP